MFNKAEKKYTFWRCIYKEGDGTIVAERMTTGDFHPLGFEREFRKVGSFTFRGQNSFERTKFLRSEITGRAVVAEDTISTVPLGVCNEVCNY